MQLSPTDDQLAGELQSRKRLVTRDFTEIWKATLVQRDGRSQAVAVKFLRYPSIIAANAPYHDQKVDLDRFLVDIKRWTKLQNENIMPLIGFQWIDQPCLIFHWYQHGNISVYLKNNPEADRLTLLAGAASGLAYLHNLDPCIVHGGIKPSNVLISDERKAMLCDFGMAPDLRLAEFGMTMADRDHGLVGYMAPELLQEGEYTKPVDVYAFGSLILEVYTEKPPMYKKKYVESMINISKGEIGSPRDHPSLPETSPLWNIMRACWQMDPHQRPPIQEVKNQLLNLQAPTESAYGILGSVCNFFLVMLRIW